MNSRSRVLIAITVVPAALVGAVLWWVTGFVPDCSNSVLNRLDAPDASRSLVVLTRDCGPGGFNTQAVIMPADGTLDGDATGFLALDGRHALDARWDAYGNVEVTLPPDAVVVQQRDKAAGVSIIYR